MQSHTLFPMASARAKRLGIALRQRREDTNLSLGQAAEELAIHKSTLSRYETAETPVTPAMVRSIMVAYGVTDRSELSKWVQLARDAQTEDWWLLYKEVVPEGHLNYIELESEADAIETYESMLVPALLQTPDYIRQVMRTGAKVLSAEEIEQRIALRQRRQKRLASEGGPRLHVIVDEYALKRPIDAGIMGDQRAYLLEVAELPRVTLQVLPLSAGLHPGQGSIVLLTYDDTSQEIAATEIVTGDLLFHKEADVRAFRDVYEALTARALSPKESLDLLAIGTVA